MALCSWKPKGSAPGHVSCDRCALPGEEYCIFHLPLEKKLADKRLAALFKEELEELFRAGNFYWVGFQFPAGINFAGKVFVTDIQAVDTCWAGDINFSRAEIKGNVSFHRTEIGVKKTDKDGPGRLDFSGARVEDGVYFNDAKIGSELVFSRAETGGNLSLKGAAVSAPADFRFLQVGGYVDCRNIVCNDSISFDNAILSGDMDLSRGKFAGKVSLQGAHLKGFRLHHATIDKGIYLERAKIEGRTDVQRLDGATPNLFFQEVEFCGPVFFRRNKKVAKGYFQRARFLHDVAFSGTVFNDKVSFHRARFWGSVQFRSVTIEGTAKFRNMVIRNAVFLDVTFNKGCDFSSTRGHFLALSGGLGKDDPLVSQQYALRLYRAAPPQLVFEDTEFGPGARFQRMDLSQSRFHQEDLSNVSFLHSQIHQTRFIGCAWGEGAESWSLVDRRRPCWRWRRPRLLWDELRWRETRSDRPRRRETRPDRPRGRAVWALVRREEEEPPPEPDDSEQKDPTASDIEVLALQLKQSLEASKDPITAGDFHFAAMEMKLAQAREKGRWARAAAMWLYKVISGYGERPRRALVFWTLGILLFTALFALFGDWKQAGQALGWKRGLEMSLRYAFYHALPFKLSQWNQNTASSITLAGPWWLWWVGELETVLLTAQFAFFLLALRRRFKR